MAFPSSKHALPSHWAYLFELTLNSLWFAVHYRYTRGPISGYVCFGTVVLNDVHGASLCCSLYRLWTLIILASSAILSTFTGVSMASKLWPLPAIPSSFLQVIRCPSWWVLCRLTCPWTMVCLRRHALVFSPSSSEHFVNIILSRITPQSRLYSASNRVLNWVTDLVPNWTADGGSYCVTNMVADQWRNSIIDNVSTGDFSPYSIQDKTRISVVAWMSGVLLDVERRTSSFQFTNLQVFRNASLFCIIASLHALDCSNHLASLRSVVLFYHRSPLVCGTWPCGQKVLCCREPLLLPCSCKFL